MPTEQRTWRLARLLSIKRTESQPLTGLQTAAAPELKMSSSSVCFRESTRPDLNIQPGLLRGAPHKPEVKIVVAFPQGLTREGENLELTCQAKGKPQPHRVKWLKVDDDVPSHAVVTGDDLFIENLNKSYNGTYRCVASNTLGESFDDYILYVYDAPTTTPSPTTAIITTTSITTTSTSSPRANQDTAPSTEPAAHDSRAGEGAPRTVDHAVIGGVVAVVVFAMLCLLIVLGRYFARHKGTYFTHEAKGADDAADADTAIINAEGGHTNSDEKKEYYI
ncbi:Cell adhesion molecule 1 [Oryzias melastigma]|uniref:Cell adhesion molecule 1 n=1 Tax=Oryzias melastigma TaxID=30732 RepID=A0A834CBB5_ORYME|nr:Cell adhesion molecule 1 [Oryzias melastigma]